MKQQTIVTLDLEGVLVPEIWIAVAQKTGIQRLKLTTRDIPDYDELMSGRLAILGVGEAGELRRYPLFKGNLECTHPGE